jgi:hypothetical protein
MTISSMRKVTALLVLASAAAQPAARSPLLASALMLGLLGSEHAHAVAVVAEDGHFDLVLSHETDRRSDHPRDAGQSDPPSPLLADADHVAHFTSDDPLNATARRKVSPPASVVAIALTLPPMAAPDSVFRQLPELRTSGAAQLRTVVLRL